MKTTKNTTENLIHSKEKQAKIIRQKTEIIESSLIDAFPYIDVPTAQNILGYSTSGTMKVLRRMVDMRILKESETRSKENRKIKLFSLTAAAKKSEKAKDIPLWTLKSHVLANQKHDMSLHLLCNDLKELYSNHLSDFSFRQNYILHHGKTTRTADLTMEFGNKELPIEYERTLKSKIRYKKILEICFEYFERHSVAFMWVFDDEKTADKFHKIVKEVDVYECRNAVDIFIWNRNAPIGERLKPKYKIWGNPIKKGSERTFWKHKAYLENQSRIEDEKYKEEQREKYLNSPQYKIDQEQIKQGQIAQEKERKKMNRKNMIAFNPIVRWYVGKWNKNKFDTFILSFAIPFFIWAFIYIYLKWDTWSLF